MDIRDNLGRKMSEMLRYQTTSTPILFLSHLNLTFTPVIFQYVYKCYSYISGNIKINVTNIAYAATSSSFPLKFTIYHIMLPVHGASEIRDSRI